MPTPPIDDVDLLTFSRDYIFIPALGAIGWLWNEIRLVKKDKAEQLDRIETSIANLAAALAKHQIDDLQSFASKADLLILRTDVNSLRQHMDDRLDRLGDQLTRALGGGRG